MKQYDVVVIGGGPAGMSAALNTKRMGKSVIILEKEAFGGQIATSPRVENIPGFKEISGVDFSGIFFEQITELGVDFDLENVLEVKKDGDLFIVKTDYNEYEGKGTGFSFANYNAHEMLGIVNYAKDVYYNHKREWNKIVDRGMKTDFSWNSSARKYEELYNSL